DALTPLAPSAPPPLHRRRPPLPASSRPCGQRCARRRRLCEHRPSAGWLWAGAAPTASPRASSSLRAGRWQRAMLLPAGGLPVGATPVAGRLLAGYCPCGWPPLTGGLAAAGWPLAGGPWLQPVGPCSRPGRGWPALHGGLVVADRPSSLRKCSRNA
ncbi:hypothetical protein BHM03_00018913, partial [Ensete ventricosum]